MPSYDVRDIKVTWLVYKLTDGLAAGEFLTPAPSNDTWRLVPDGMGGAVRVYHPGTSGTLTLQVETVSDIQRNLHIAHAVDKLTRSQIGPLVVKNTLTKEKEVFNGAFIMAPPERSWGTSSAVSTWTFGYSTRLIIPAF